MGDHQAVAKNLNESIIQLQRRAMSQFTIFNLMVSAVKDEEKFKIAPNM